MVLKKMLGALGVGGPSVDTVLASPHTRPGERLAGEVRITGGTQAVDIDHVGLSLVTRIEVEHGDEEHNATVEFHHAVVDGRFHLPAGGQRVVPFTMTTPWESPITDVYGQRLPGMTLGLRTELAVAKALDKSDLDPLSVHPVPAQERVLDAFGELGFRFRRADLERGHIYGVQQELPFFQEIEFAPPSRYAGRVNEVELTFVASPYELVVVLEADKRGGFFTPSQDAFGRFHVSYEDAMSVDWAQHIDGWLRQRG